jgi:serine/threonine protein kinase
VDRIYIAPELNNYKTGPKCDVWSIGIVLYLLITGGIQDKRHEEFFDFKEAVWFSVSEELKEFMLMALVVDPRQRASLDQLLSTEFISSARQSSLDSTPLAETNLAEGGGNMYKFYMAHCINEVICRFRINRDKRRQIHLLRDRLVDSKPLVYGETPGMS